MRDSFKATSSRVFLIQNLNNQVRKGVSVPVCFIGFKPLDYIINHQSTV